MCLGIRTRVHQAVNPDNDGDKGIIARVDECCERVLAKLEVKKNGADSARRQTVDLAG